MYAIHEVLALAPTTVSAFFALKSHGKNISSSLSEGFSSSSSQQSAFSSGQLDQTPLVLPYPAQQGSGERKGILCSTEGGHLGHSL